MKAILCDVCNEENAQLRVTVTDLQGVVLDATAMCITCGHENDLTAHGAKKVQQ